MVFREVIAGFRNDLIPPKDIKDLIQKVYNDRLSICKICIAYDEGGTGCAVRFTQPCCNSKVEVVPGVNGCGCSLRRKLKCLSCSCPANKWEAVTTDEEEKLINKKIDEK